MRRIAGWALLAVLAVAWQGKALLRDFRPPRKILVDFYQDWASARNFLQGRPVYEPQRESSQRYLGHSPEGDDPYFIDINAHPPTAVLLSLPFAGLSYPNAVLAWNLLSLAALAASVWLITRQLGMRWERWHVLPAVALLMICWPLRQQIQQGQLTLLLLLLIVGAWAANRWGHEKWAGVLLGIAAVIKIFPGFLFLYFLFRRQWRVVGVGAVTVLVLTGATLAVLGEEAYISYVRDAPPLVGEWRSSWNNCSLPGLWSKLFDPGSKGSAVAPLLHNPALARVLVVVSCALIVALLAVLVQRAQSRPDCDRAFGAAVAGMLLLVPVTWEHSLLLLLLPLAVLWIRWPAGCRQRRVVEVAAMLLVLKPGIYHQLFRVGSQQVSDRVMSSATDALLVLSIQCYALVALFVLATRSLRGRRATAPAVDVEHVPTQRREPALAGAQSARLSA
jgi:hypothetical protein